MKQGGENNIQAGRDVNIIKYDFNKEELIEICKETFGVLTVQAKEELHLYVKHIIYEICSKLSDVDDNCLWKFRQPKMQNFLTKLVKAGVDHDGKCDELLVNLILESLSNNDDETFIVNKKLVNIISEVPINFLKVFCMVRPIIMFKSYEDIDSLKKDYIKFIPLCNNYKELYRIVLALSDLSLVKTNNHIYYKSKNILLFEMTDNASVIYEYIQHREKSFFITRNYLDTIFMNIRVIH